MILKQGSNILKQFFNIMKLSLLYFSVIALGVLSPPFLALKFPRAFHVLFSSRHSSPSFFVSFTVTHFSVHMSSHPSVMVQRKDFHIEYPGTLNARLKHPLICYETHRFKQLKEVDILTRRAKDPSIVSVFECSHANKAGCPCKFVLREDQTGEVIGNHALDQAHLNDVYSWRLFKAKSLILDDLVNDPFIAPQKLLDKLFKSPEFIVDQFTPPKASLQYAIARLKKAIFGRSKIEADELRYYLQNIQTLDGNQFILAEETYLNHQTTKRIIIMASPFQIDVARRCSGKFMGDGTFECVPSFFTQMYTIHTFHGASSFPVAFALMEEKTTQAYEILFRVLNDSGFVIKTFMSDFEKGSRNAVRNIYPGVNVKGCWFHYTQSIMRRVKKVGLQREYASVPFVNTTVRRLFALSFVKPAEVPDAVGAIEAEMSAFGGDGVGTKLNELMTYFRRTWLHKYPPDEWNQCADIAFRSNNWSESFHAAFSRRFARGHPNIRVMVEALKLVEREVHVSWNEFMTRPPRRTRTDDNTEELERVMRMRDELWHDNVLGFVDAISRIPVFILLRYEKEQLEFARRNTGCVERSTLDRTERRLSEVVSLIERDAPSLVDVVEVDALGINGAEAMEVITRNRLDARKRRLLERIECVKAGRAGRQTADVPMDETDGECGSLAVVGQDVCQAGCAETEDARGVVSRDDDMRRVGCDGDVSETRTRHARRRRSVVAKMNAAIRRQRAKRRP